MKRERYCLSVAVFILLRKGNQICMFKRTGTGWMDGFYSLPAGGLEEGETLTAAAAREANEELGVSIAPENLELSHTLHVRTEERSWVGHFFSCTHWQGEPYLAEPEKHSALGWEEMDVLPHNTIPYVRQAIDNILISRVYSEYGW